MQLIINNDDDWLVRSSANTMVQNYASLPNIKGVLWNSFWESPKIEFGLTVNDEENASYYLFHMENNLTEEYLMSKRLMQSVSPRLLSYMLVLYRVFHQKVYFFF